VFAQAIAAGDPDDFEARIRRFDGIYRWCQVRGLPWRDTNGLIGRWYVVLVDIDERTRAEDALRETSGAPLSRAERRPRRHVLVGDSGRSGLIGL
jgi:PAS fold